MPTLSIFSEPIGSQFVSTIGSNDPANKNDFTIYVVGDGNFTLAQTDLTVPTWYSIQSFEGKNSVYKAVIRPPVPSSNSVLMTVSIAQNAVPEGNPAVSQNIRISKVFPDADAETPTQYLQYTHTENAGSRGGIAVSPTHIYVSGRISSQNVIFTLNHDGTLDNSIAWNNANVPICLDYVNGHLLYGGQGSGGTIPGVAQHIIRVFYDGIQGITHTRAGILRVRSSSFALASFSNEHLFQAVDADVTNSFIAHQGGYIYGRSGGLARWTLSEFTEDNEIRFVKALNITGRVSDSSITDIAIYQDKMFYSYRTNFVEIIVDAFDLRKYRPMAKNTKFNIYPQFIKVGETLDLKPFSPDAERIIFDVGFNKPTWLSISSAGVLSVGSGATTTVQPVLVKLRGINRVDSIAFSFYLIIQNEPPRWKELESLSMRAGSSYDLFQLVENADRIEVHPNYTLPAGASLSNGIFTIGTTGGEVGFRAYNDDTRQYADMDNTTGTF